MAKAIDAKLKEARAFRDLFWHQLQETADTATEVTQNPSIKTLFCRRFARIESIQDNFMKYHNEIVSLVASTTNPDLESEEDFRREFDKTYFAIEEIYYTLCAPPSSSHGASPTPTTLSGSSHSQVRLPKIDLPKFDGNLAQWSTFFDLYNILVHNNSNLSDIEKFQYLSVSLSGDPLSLIKAVPLNASNYSVAYDSLKDRYDNKRLLASNYWHSMQNSPKLTNESHYGLRSLLNTFTENLAALTALNIEKWDFVLFSSLVDKVDPQTRKLFERSLPDQKIPSYKVLKDFLENQCRALETAATDSKSDISSKNLLNSKQARSVKSVPTKAHNSNTSYNTMVATKTNSNSSKCSLCSQAHSLYNCSNFLSKSPKDRFEMAKRLKLCINCLKSSHLASSCPSSHHCRECTSRHHTLLHFGPTNGSSGAGLHSQKSDTSKSTVLPSEKPIESNVLNLTTIIHPSQPPTTGRVLLPTIQLDIVDRHGQPHKVRALLDSGSEVSLIRQQCVRKLGLKTNNSSTSSILGIGQTPAIVCGQVSMQIRPRSELTPTFPVRAIVVPDICSNVPHFPIEHSNWSHISGLKLADPSWHTPTPVDLLLGADIYALVVQSARVLGPSDLPVALQSIFGWILLGSTPESKCHIAQSLLTILPPSLDETIRSFWEIESVPNKPIRHPEDDLAEQSFLSSVYRLLDGRFGVSLPFKSLNPSFKNSLSIADRRWLRLESRLLKDSKLYQLYLEFMKDYLDQDHMSLVSSPIPDDAYVIPHHCVVKENGENLKIRVVFDASANDSQNVSLNDTLLTGPKLQSDIVSILLRFRAKAVVFTCDIRQMYRQIAIHPDDRKYQFIRFRFSPDQPTQTFRLNTVTYGVSSAPFLAIRTLLYLADLESAEFPLAAEAIKQNLYVDDFACGGETVHEADSLKVQLTHLLLRGGFSLRKWASNVPELLKDIGT